MRLVLDLVAGQIDHQVDKQTFIITNLLFLHSKRAELAAFYPVSSLLKSLQWRNILVVISGGSFSGTIFSVRFLNKKYICLKT